MGIPFTAEGKGRRVIRVPHSNLPFLKKEFADIIQFEKETDQTGNKTTGYGLRRTFIFKDKSYLSITEYLDKDGTIGCFFYDWYDKDKEILAKFHSEAHRDKDYQTETEPYHIHSKGTS